MYVDFEYYLATYGGTALSENTFPAAERKAEAYIRYLTYLNGDIFTAESDSIKDAVCSAADAYYLATVEMSQGGNVKSESKDGLSVSFIVARKDGETVEEYAKRCMYQTVHKYLLPTGWLSRKVRCGNADKCGCCNCL